MENKSSASRFPKRVIIAVLVLACILYGVITVYRQMVFLKKVRNAALESKALIAGTQLKESLPEHEFRWVAKDWFKDKKTLELCAAIETGDLNQIQSVIDSGADVNAKGPRGMSLLLWAHSYGSDVLELLLKNGADPNVVWEWGYSTPTYLFREETTYLFFVVELSSTRDDPQYDRYIDLLLKYGADSDIGKYSCLSVASANFITNGKKAFHRLIDAGADVNPTGNYFGYPVENAVGYGKELQELLDRGAVYDVATPQGSRLQRRLFSYAKDEHMRWKTSGEDHEATLNAVKWLEERGVSFDEPVPLVLENEKRN